MGLLFAIPHLSLTAYCLFRGRFKDRGWNRLAALQFAAAVFCFWLGTQS